MGLDRAFWQIFGVFAIKQADGNKNIPFFSCLMDGNLAIMLNGKKTGLDVSGGETNYISHAHSDHSYALKSSSPIFCSDITAQMLEIANSRLSPLPKDFSLHNAGHILGSTQLSISDSEFGKFVYTGDFKLRDSLTCKGAPILACDTLIIECTYGSHSVSFPPCEEVFAQMENWSRQNKEHIQLWGGYSCGKAQELVKFLNDYMGQTPIVHPKVSQICQHYKNNGTKLDFISADSAEASEVMRSPFCAVFPPHLLSAKFAYQLSHAHRRKAAIALATGWSGLRHLSCSISFPLSDHADFSEILNYAKECGAKKIFLAHGENEETAKRLKKHGLNAFALLEFKNEIGKKAEPLCIQAKL